MKIFALIIIVIAAIAAFYFASTAFNNSLSEKGEVNEILSFEDCEKAGYPVMESYPRRCALPDGRTYTEELAANQSPAYENAGTDMITVELPFPGAVVGKDFSVIGQARGNWYFEASFPIEVVGKNGELLAQTYATAEGDWMTTEFVPFHSDIKVPESYIGPATIILRKDNPSGMPENDASVSFPVTIEY